MEVKNKGHCDVYKIDVNWKSYQHRPHCDVYNVDIGEMITMKTMGAQYWVNNAMSRTSIECECNNFRTALVYIVVRFVTVLFLLCFCHTRSLIIDKPQYYASLHCTVIRRQDASYALPETAMQCNVYYI